MYHSTGFITTRRILERLPEEHMNVEAAREIDDVGRAGHAPDQPAELASRDFSLLDLSTVPLRREPLERREDVLEEFDANVVKLEKLLAECDEKTLGEEWTLRNGDHIILRNRGRSLFAPSDYATWYTTGRN
jgi:hypothetical protein